MVIIVGSGVGGSGISVGNTATTITPTMKTIQITSVSHFYKKVC